MTPEEKLASLKISLPKPHFPTHLPNYIGYKIAGPFLFLGGHGPFKPDGVSLYAGKVGEDIGVQEAYQHARVVGMYLLASIREALGTLNRVESIVKLIGMVNAVPGFKDHPLVINGCSDLLVEIFGESCGRHARTAIGMGSLPHCMTVEVEAIVLIRD